MKKLFLIPLMTLMTCVMAWGESTHSVGTYTELQSALSAAANGDIIKMTADIAYPTNGTGLVNITKSITLDGNGHTLYGYGTANIAASGAVDNYPTALAVNAAVFDAENAPTLNVTLKNLTLGNIKNEYWPNGTQKTMVDSPARFYGLTVYDGVASLIMDNVNILVGRKDKNNNKDSQPGGWHQMFCITGINSTPLDLTFTNSHIYAGEGKYPVYVLKPIDATLENSIFEGYCALYFKYRASGVYGNVVGSRGSEITAQNCAFNAPNVHNGQSNSFAIFPLEDDGITFNLNNCSYNAQQIGNQYQMFISLQYLTRESGFQPVVFNLSGDNTHVYNVNLSAFATTGWHDNDDEHLDTYVPEVNIPFELNISGGTYTVNPEDITFHTYVDGTSFGIGHATIVDGYEASEANQGGTTVYRVVKKAQEKAGGTLYDLNDLVKVEVTPGDSVAEGVAAGNNPISSFDLSTGTEMTLNQEVTTAGYVQVSDHATEGATTVTVAKNDAEPEHSQTLVINNGLAVQGESQVIVEPTAALVIGEGGITTQKPENIIIEADEDGAASLLLEPSITVNQTPELTVKMTATTGVDAWGGRVWHRFALPVDQLTSAWEKTRADGTYLYGWDYNIHDWAQVDGGSLGMTQWNGYTLSEWSTETGLFDVTYTFKGHLAGNMDAALNFVTGYNFFGNSYTGYISAAKMLNGIADGNVDGSVWMWDAANQTYGAASLSDLLNNPELLEDWQTEVAPMQTFILRLAHGNSGSAAINYADAIWGNPRYGNPSSPSPRRRTHSDNYVEDDAYMRIVITAANGKSDYVVFKENSSLSDAYDNNFDATKFMNENHFNFYSTVGSDDYTCVATNSLLGKTMSLRTLNDVNYTMSFKFVEGKRYSVKDNVTGQITDIEEGCTYSFTVQPNAIIDGRFEIVNRDMVATQIENAEVSADVKGIYTVLGQYVGEDFNALPNGIYVVNGVKVVK